MKIKSILDVITNSSSECYLVKTNIPKSEWLRELGIVKTADLYCSGMGGVLEIFDNKTEGDSLDWEDGNNEICIPFRHLPDDYLVIHVDNGYSNCRDFITGHPDYVESIWGENAQVDKSFRLEYWKKKEEEINKAMSEVKSDDELQKLWDEYEEIYKRINEYED